jgi:thymidine kinase
MFSGKSTELIRHIRRYKSIGKNVLVITHKIDERYGKNNVFSHDKEIEAAKPMDKLMDIFSLQEFHYADVVCIDEAQFFSDLTEFTKRIATYKKSVVVAGLDGDYKQDPIGFTTTVIPLADSIEKLYALCVKCGNSAPFSRRKRMVYEGGEDARIVVGAGELYESVCRKHL